MKNNIKKDDKSVKVLENEEQSSICFSSLMVKKEKKLEGGVPFYHISVRATAYIIR